MGRKINLELHCKQSIEDITSVMIHTISVRYLLNLIYTDITNHSNDCDMTDVISKYTNCLNDTNDIQVGSLGELASKRAAIYDRLLDLVIEMDTLFAESKVVDKGIYILGINDAMTRLLVSLAEVEVTEDYIDFDKMMIIDDYISNLESDIDIVDETQFLVNLASSELNMKPINVDKFKNTFIESKLATIQEILKDVDNGLSEDMDLLHKQIDKMYSKFYSISYDTLTDDEKVEKADKAIAPIAKHKTNYINMEKSLVSANELQRQLTIHVKRLEESLKEEVENYRKKIEKNPQDEEYYQSDIDGVTFVTNKYFAEIESSREQLQDIKERISVRAKMLEAVENALRQAMPSEVNMSKYTTLGFKFQDLRNRLEIAKSQILKDDKDMLTLVDTAVVGLGVLIKFSVSSKDIFVRNSMLHSLLNCATQVYEVVDTTDAELQASQTIFINNKLNDYSNANNAFDNDMNTFRHVANNAIRDISIMMSKTMNINSVSEMVDYIDITLKQLEQIIFNLEKKHEEQTQILQDILKI